MTWRQRGEEAPREVVVPIMREFQCHKCESESESQKGRGRELEGFRRHKIIIKDPTTSIFQKINVNTSPLTSVFEKSMLVNSC